MNDLNQIIRNNGKAGASDVTAQITAGKFVAARYAGVSYLSHSVFDSQAEADSHAASVRQDLPVSERIVVLHPIANAGYTPSGDAPATLASLAKAHADKLARNAEAVAA
jgi:hypothetical protein